jgi:hypothetical protein
MWGIMRFFLMIVAALGLSALASCTVVHVDEGKVARSRFGLLRIVPDERNGTLAYRSTGVGLVPGVDGATIGFKHEAVVVAAGGDCRVVILELPDDPRTVALWRDILDRNPNVCIAGGGKR